MAKALLVAVAFPFFINSMHSNIYTTKTQGSSRDVSVIEHHWQRTSDVQRRRSAAHRSKLDVPLSSCKAARGSHIHVFRLCLGGHVSKQSFFPFLDHSSVFPEWPTCAELWCVIKHDD